MIRHNKNIITNAKNKKKYYQHHHVKLTEKAIKINIFLFFYQYVPLYTSTHP